MHPFRNLSIRYKVALMGGLLIAAFLGLGILFITSVNTLINANQLLGNTQIAMKEANAFLESILQTDSTVREHLLTGDENLKLNYDTYVSQAGDHLLELQKAVADPALRLPMDPRFTQQILRMGSAFKDWRDRIADPAWAIKAKSDPGALMIFLSSSEKGIKAIRYQVSVFSSQQQELSYKRFLDSTHAAEFALQTAFFGSVLTLLLVLFGFNALTQSMVSPILTLTETSRSLGTGDYSHRAPVQPGRDELSRLTETFNAMAGNLERAHREQSEIRSRLEALNAIATNFSRALSAIERAEAVVTTLLRDFKALSAEMWIENADGWICIEGSGNGETIHHTRDLLPERFNKVIETAETERWVDSATKETTWINPLLRESVLDGILKIRFPEEQWIYAEPLMNSVNRFCVNAFELAQAYEEVSAERRRLDAILNNTGEGVLVLNREGRLTLANPASQRLLFLKRSEAIDKPINEAFQGDLYAALLQFILSPYPKDVSADFSGPLPFGDRYVTATRSLIRDEIDVGVVIVVRDITQQVEVDRMKSEFISIVSHELRTPLTSIKGSVGLLLGKAAGDLSDKVVSLLQIAQSNSDRLIRLINDILDISKIESGRVQMDRKSLNAADAVRTAVSGLEGFARETQTEIRASLDESLPLTVLGDYDRIVQVITNLLSNAIKFSPRNSVVEISARRKERFIEIEVIDQGPGIPPDRQEKLFQKFYQVDSSSARAKSGTGLGLAISHAIIKEHGGLIGVESDGASGSRFWLTLPAYRESTEIVVEKEVDANLARVLVCEDDPDILHLISLLLENHGYQCDPALSGEEALEKAKKNDYDLITLDLLLPGMDGLEVARRLHEDQKTSEVPIVFISAMDETETAQRMRISGWVAKPIDENRLQETIRQALRLKSERIRKETSRERPLILVADDDPDVLSVISEIISGAGMEPCTAKNGVEALERIGELKPDAIILDLMMPEPDGFEIVNLLRRNKQTRNIPILVLTAKDLTAEEKTMLIHRQTRLLTKTYASQESIIDDLTQLLERRD